MPTSRELQILVVEDDEGDFMSIERAFEKAHVVNRLVRACDGVEALDVLRGTGGRERLRRPYIVLCDINMPRLDGLNFLAELRQDPELKGTVVFVLTTSRHDQDINRAYALNAAGYIVKANAGKDFLDVVELLGGYSRIVELE